MKPQNFEEKLVWYYMLALTDGTFSSAIYFRPALSWFLTICKRSVIKPNIVQTKKIAIHYLIWIWLVLQIMELALIMGHKDLTWDW